MREEFLPDIDVRLFYEALHAGDIYAYISLKMPMRMLMLLISLLYFSAMPHDIAECRSASRLFMLFHEFAALPLRTLPAQQQRAQCGVIKTSCRCTFARFFDSFISGRGICTVSPVNTDAFILELPTLRHITLRARLCRHMMM